MLGFGVLSDLPSAPGLNEEEQRPQDTQVPCTAWRGELSWGWDEAPTFMAL